MFVGPFLSQIGPADWWTGSWQVKWAVFLCLLKLFILNRPQLFKSICHFWCWGCTPCYFINARWLLTQTPWTRPTSGSSSSPILYFLNVKLAIVLCEQVGNDILVQGVTPGLPLNLFGCLTPRSRTVLAICRGLVFNFNLILRGMFLSSRKLFSFSLNLKKLQPNQKYLWILIKHTFPMISVTSRVR